MAIEYVNLKNEGNKLSEFIEQVYPLSIYQYDSYPNSDNREHFYNAFVNKSFDFWIEGTNTYNFGAIYIVCEVIGGNTNRVIINFKRKSDDYVLFTYQANNGGGRHGFEIYLSFAIDRERQYGYCILGTCQVIEYESNKWYYFIGQLRNDDNTLYQLLLESIQEPYNWQSVPSLSGKNGILTLSTLNDVNDGEPVETSDTSKFNLTDDSNVSALVAAHFSQ